MPMRIIVSDSICLIDLRKASLLDVFLQLPYEILIPNTLFEDELIKFTVEQKEALVRGGLQIVDLPGDGVLRAQKVVGALPHLSIHDGFAFALAEQNPGCILLTGDPQASTTHSWICCPEHRSNLNTNVCPGSRTALLPSPVSVRNH
jgi:hypothetical protein